MASTSRSLFLLSLLVSSFCVAVTANRSLEETNKLSLVDGLPLAEILHGKHGLVHLLFTVDLSKVVHPVQILLVNAAGDLVKLEVVEGVVTELENPIDVKVTVSETVIIVVEALGEEVHVPLKLSELGPVLKIVGGVVHLVLKLVEKVVGELHVLEILNPVTDGVLKTITGAL